MSIRVELPERLYLLVDRYCGATSTPEEAVELESLLRDNLEAERYFLDSCHLQAQLYQLHATVNAVREGIRSARDQHACPSRAGRYLDRLRQTIVTNLAASLMVAGLTMTIILLTIALRIAPDWNAVVPSGEGISVEFVAQITSSEQATFDKSSDGNFQNRDLFDDDQIVLASGLVVIEYGTGARVVLEGPATYHIDGANGGDLRHGKVVAEVETVASKGFTVAIPGARIVDLGTQFGVEVSADGGSQVAVLSGAVELIGNRPQQRLRIVAGEAASIEAGSGNIARQDVANSQFASALASRLKRLEYPPIAVRATAERFEGRNQANNTISGFQVAGGNHRKLVLVASWESADASISAVWKGKEAFQTAIISGTGRNCAILYLDDPTPGRGDVVVTFGSATRSRVGVASLINAAVGVGPTSSNDGVAGSLATTEPDSLILGVYTTNSPIGKVDGPFSQMIYNGDAGSCWGNAGWQSEPIAGSKPYTWKAAGAKEDAHVLAAFVNASTAALDKRYKPHLLNGE